MIDLRAVVRNITPTFVGNGAENYKNVQFPTLAQIIPVTDLSSWHWRSIASLQQEIAKHTDPKKVELPSFRPEFTSAGLHEQFIWIKFFPKTHVLVITIGDITDCDFAPDPGCVLLLPMQWTNRIIECVTSGIHFMEQDGHVSAAGGERGVLMFA